MKAIDELTSKSSRPKLVANFKQPERKLLSVFMSLLEIIPAFRGAFLERCSYGAGKTCQYQSFMEPQYNSKISDVRPDGLVVCERGAKTWSAYIEAKAGNSPIRPEQIQSYAELAKNLDVDTIISISNEFSIIPSELPYHLGYRQMKGRDVLHFSWAELRTFTEIFFDSTTECNVTEKLILEQCLDFFWSETSGIQTYDAMPSEWSNFVQSAATELGFTTKTPGITEIVHGWQQERRDLLAKLIYKTKKTIELRHDAGLRADAEQRLKLDRKALADDYILSANYYVKDSKAVLRVLANLRSCQISTSLEFNGPSNKKAKATVTWIAGILSDLESSDTKISFNWKGRGGDKTMVVSEFLDDPSIAYEGQQDAPKSIRLINETHNVRRFKSRKGFIEDLEKMVIELAEDGVKRSIA